MEVHQTSGYLKVTNVGELPLHGVRLLGESSKSGEKIGQFGTGLKEAIALCTRLDTSLIIQSGGTTITFHTTGTPVEIMFKIESGGDGDRYRAGTDHALNISPKFGHHDWTSYWQVLREVVCNALDEGIVEHRLVSALQPPEPGFTSVYLSLSDELLAAYKELPSKLLALSKPTPLSDVTDIGRLYPPQADKGRVYTKGVYVQSCPTPSIFDYEIHNLKLNESRSVDWYVAYGPMARLICASGVPIIQQFIEGVSGDGGTDVTERHFQTWDFPVDRHTQQQFTQAFKALHGVDAVACATQHQAELVRKAGKTAIKVPDFLYGILKRIGVCTIAQEIALSTDDGITRGPATAEQQKVFDKLWAALDSARLTRGRRKPPLLAFTKTGTEDGGKCMGFYDRQAQAVYINSDIAGSREERMAMIEEICHYVTLADDLTRDFQNWCTDAIDALLWH
jgi:hypothetical protein